MAANEDQNSSDAGSCTQEGWRSYHTSVCHQGVKTGTFSIPNQEHIQFRQIQTLLCPRGVLGQAVEVAMLNK